jgi:hypothetical protein
MKAAARRCLYRTTKPCTPINHDRLRRPKAKKLLSLKEAGDRALRRLPGRIVTAWNKQAARSIRE